MTFRRIVLLLVVVLPWTPIAASPQASGSAASTLPLIMYGEVQAFDFFDQTFLMKHDDGSMETIPFSRWTDFQLISLDSRSKIHRREIAPTDVQVGDRLCIRLDANAATAERIQVLPGQVTASRRPVQTARR